MGAAILGVIATVVLLIFAPGASVLSLLCVFGFLAWENQQRLNQQAVLNQLKRLNERK